MVPQRFKARRRASALLFATLILSTAQASAAPADSATEHRLHIAWPAGWTVADPVYRDRVVYLHAERASAVGAARSLQVTALSTVGGNKVIGMSDLHGLAEQLRDAALRTAVEKQAALQTLGSQTLGPKTMDPQTLNSVSCYYFVVTDAAPGPGAARQLIEAVCLQSGYLINATLLTDDAGSVDTVAMLRALGDLRVEQRTAARE